MAIEPIGDVTEAGGSSSAALYLARRRDYPSAAAVREWAAADRKSDNGIGRATGQSLDGRYRAYNDVVSAPPERTSAATTKVLNKGSDATDAELQQFFGSSAPQVRSLLSARSDMKVKDLLAFRHDSEGLQAVNQLLTHRSDLQLGDLICKGSKGTIQIDPMIRDQSSRDFLMSRTNVKPQELKGMRRQLAKAFDSPGLARDGYSKALELMKVRTDLRPADIGKMANSMGSAAKGTKAGQGPEGGRAAFDMFDKSTKLLTKRTDLYPSDMTKLTDKASESFGGKGPDGLSNLADSFGSATDLLQNRQGMGVDQVTNVMDTVNKHFGDDGANKTAAFRKATNMMSRVPQMDSGGVNAMLKKTAEEPPPLHGDKLLQAFDSTASDVMEGRTSLSTATTPRGEQTDGQAREEKAGAERTRINLGRPRTPREQAEREQNDGHGSTLSGRAHAKHGHTQAHSEAGIAPTPTAETDHGDHASTPHQSINFIA